MPLFKNKKNKEDKEAEKQEKVDSRKDKTSDRRSYRIDKIQALKEKGKVKNSIFHPCALVGPDGGRS